MKVVDFVQTRFEGPFSLAQCDIEPISSTLYMALVLTKYIPNYTLLALQCGDIPQER